MIFLKNKIQHIFLEERNGSSLHLTEEKHLSLLTLFNKSSAVDIAVLLSAQFLFHLVLFLSNFCFATNESHGTANQLPCSAEEAEI